MKLHFLNIFAITLFMCQSLVINAQETKSLKPSHFSASLELSTKYMWRGIEYGTSPVLFPMLSYDNSGFNAYVMGGYATNGSHQEVDLGVSYTNDWLTVAVNDYYYPTAVGEQDRYFEFAKGKTGHSVEAAMTVAPEQLPLYMMLSAYVYGNDKKLDGKQAYSSYVELGYVHNFTDDNAITVLAGANLNKSFYTNYEKGFNVCNIAVKYATALPFGKYKLPVSASYVLNPYMEKSYFTLSLYLR